MQKGNYEGGRPSLWLKAPAGAQAALVDAAPERFFVPPYVGHKGWIGLWLDGRTVAWAELEHLVTESYRAIAPARLVAELDGDGPQAARAGRSGRRSAGAAAAGPAPHAGSRQRARRR